MAFGSVQALRGPCGPLRCVVLGFAASAFVCGAAAAAAIQTNENYIEEVTRRLDLDIADKKAVFAYVFKNLPDRVKVYPTENYYYFRFSHGGVSYNGNLRFENELRDQGKLHFAYTQDFSDWSPPGDTLHVLFERKDGIDLDRIDDWTYRVAHAGKSVVFELNKMEGVKPPPGMVAPEERYIGPIFDESAVRFFLVYNPKLKQFLYLLDETGPQADQLVTTQVSDRVLLGQRTGFAFYRDHKRDRRILIGVYEGNSRLNTYFDGPFDQLPDNFIEGDVLRDALLEIEPGLKGKIDRFGSSFDGQTRYMIAPYFHYSQERDLAMFHRCATSKRIPPDLYYACFAIDESSERPAVIAERKRPAPAKPARGRRSR